MPYVRGLECCRHHFEGKIPVDEWADLKKRLDSIKKADPKNHNKQGVLEIDEFLDLVVDMYKRLDRLAAEKIKELFYAVDFGASEFISMEEMATAYRIVVKDNLGKDYGYLLF